MTCGGGGCGGCVQKAECVSGENRWPAWLCDDTGPSRGGGCNRIQGAWFGKAYYCCPQS